MRADGQSAERTEDAGRRREIGELAGEAMLGHGVVVGVSMMRIHSPHAPSGHGGDRPTRWAHDVARLGDWLSPLTCLRIPRYRGQVPHDNALRDRRPPCHLHTRSLGIRDMLG